MVDRYNYDALGARNREAQSRIDADNRARQDQWNRQNRDNSIPYWNRKTYNEDNSVDFIYVCGFIIIMLLVCYYIGEVARMTREK